MFAKIQLFESTNIKALLAVTNNGKLLAVSCIVILCLNSTFVAQK